VYHHFVVTRLWILLLLAAAGCSRPSETSDAARQDQPFEGVSSAIRVADPQAAPQLLKGWHLVEEDRWRWTERKFSLALKIPATGKPATLELKFSLPEAVLSRLGPVTLAATINGVPLPKETYTQSGDQTYTRAVAGEALTGAIARLDFELDKALPPNDVDKRELGLVVSTVALR